MRWPARLLGLVLLGSSLGCIIWPFPTGGLLAGRGRIEKDYAAPLEVGKSTREDVLLRLGEPDVALKGGYVFLYQWTEEMGFFAILSNSGSPVIPFPGHRSVRLDFDAEGRLARVVFQEGNDLRALVAEVNAGS